MNIENEYEANTSDLMIPTSRKKLFADVHGVKIKALNKGTSQFSFTLPDYLNFLNNQKLRLRYDLTMSGRGMPKPNPSAGVHSLFRNMLVRTQNGMKTLETLDEYSSMVAYQYSYSQDQGIIHNREINEGLSLTNNSGNQLFWAPQPLPSVGISAANVAKKVAINQEIYSGLLGTNSTVMPVGAMSGVRLTCEMNTLKKAIRLANDSSKTGSKNAKVGIEVTAATWNNGAADYTVDITTTTLQTSESGFEVGDAIYYDVAGVDTLIGLVVSIGNNSTNMQIKVKGDVGLSLNGPLLAVNTVLYTRPQDRFNGWTPSANITAGNGNAAIALGISAAAVKVDYVMENLELIVDVVQPPKSYVDLMVKKINSKEGLVMNYKTNNLLKVGVVGIQGSLAASIPNTSRRLYAMNILPVAISDTFDGENLIAQSDDLENYQFVVNSSLQPTRVIDTTRMNLTPSYISQQHVQEMRKSLVSSGVFVRSLQNPEKNVVIGRAFAMGGAVSDVTKSDLQVRLEYGSNATTQKILFCFMCEARTLIVRDTEVDVIV
jgi:hypothetical protein